MDVSSVKTPMTVSMSKMALIFPSLRAVSGAREEPIAEVRPWNRLAASTPAANNVLR